jgi:hypothetical protein
MTCLEGAGVQGRRTASVEVRQLVPLLVSDRECALLRRLIGHATGTPVRRGPYR